MEVMCYLCYSASIGLRSLMTTARPLRKYSISFSCGMMILYHLKCVHETRLSWKAGEIGCSAMSFEVLGFIGITNLNRTSGEAVGFRRIVYDVASCFVYYLLLEEIFCSTERWQV